jgi:hypothetical protein
LRLWDGRVWTEHVSQMPVSSWSVPISVHQGVGRRNLAGFGCVTFAAAVLLVTALVIGLVEKVSQRDEPGGEDSAVAACRQAVVARLQTPESARFPSVEATEGAPDFWTVRGTVDSLSAVGITERILFTCTVSPDEQDQWRLDGLRLIRL